MSRLINSRKSKDKRPSYGLKAAFFFERKRSFYFERSGLLTLSIAVFFLAGCAPRVATSFWKIGTPSDSAKEGYTVIHAEGKTRHCYPIEVWTDGPETDTYHALHHHGVAVESALMAYRIYFDKKQTVDVYCKRKPQLELAQSYWYPDDSLLAAGYGDDILRVSGTVGVGSVKYWNGRLYHIEEVGERQQLIVQKGRNEATVAVRDVDWTVPDGGEELPETRHIVNLDVRYTIKAGHRDMRCDVFCSSPGDSLPFRGGQEGPALCTGVQTIPAKGGKDTTAIILDNGVLLASWGTDWPVNDSVKFAKETVGLGVFIPKEYAGALVHDKQNNLCLLNPLPLRGGTGRGCRFYLTCCGATKENHPVARTAGEWIAYLKKWAKKLK